MKRIEIFKAGTHTSAEGKVMVFTDIDVDAMAKAYNPLTFKSPVVIGHPKTDDPAYGWIYSLSAQEGKLFADIDDLEPNFEEAVKGRRYSKISSSFYHPEHPNNPMPGTWYLKHIGFLGAVAPAVKGLTPVAFADAESITFEFSEKLEDENKEIGFAEREAALLRREKELLRKENTSFVESLIDEGKLLPKNKNDILSFMESLNNTLVVNFSEGESNQTEAFKKLLKANPKIVHFGETAKNEEPEKLEHNFVAPKGYNIDPEQLEIRDKALSYMEENPGVSFINAVKQLKE